MHPRRCSHYSPRSSFSGTPKKARGKSDKIYIAPKQLGFGGNKKRYSPPEGTNRTQFSLGFFAPVAQARGDNQRPRFVKNAAAASRRIPFIFQSVSFGPLGAQRT